VETLKNKKVFFLIAIASIGLLITGLTSELYLGDEVYHYRFAKNMFEAGKRVSHDPLYESGTPPGFFYATDPLWDGVLAVLWKAMGRVSFPVAQIYHTCFYALLLIFTYLVGKRIFGKEEGAWSCLIMATMPMAVAFGILFYVDVPATALSMVAFYLVINKKYLWGGLIFSLMYLTKRNACFLIPAMALIPLYFEKKGLLKKLRNLSVLLIPLGVTFLWDMRWRYLNIESSEFQIQGYGITQNVTTQNVTTQNVTIRNVTFLENILSRVRYYLWGTKEYLNSSLINPLDLAKYLGVVLTLFFVFYFLLGLFRKEKKEIKVLIFGLLTSYLVFFLFLFGFNSDIRYLFPIVPFLCLLASRNVISIQKKWASFLIVGICLVQFGATLAYVRIERQIPKEIKEGFSYIKIQIPREALLMYPEYSLLEATERRFIWTSFFDVEQHLLKNRYAEYQGDMSRVFFWNSNTEDLMRSLRINKLDYIVVKKSRIYDDSKIKHLGGYPKSFVQRMPRLPFLKLVFENNGMSIWEVRKECLPPL